MAAWSTYFSTLAESSATMAGLLFVAVSINLNRVVAIGGLPERALASVLGLMVVLVVSALGLVPQPGVAFGVELVVLGAIGFATGTRLRKAIVGSESLRYASLPMWARDSIFAVLTLPLAAGGLLEALGVPGALFWIVPSMLLAFVLSMLNAWVILVEIVR